MAERLANILEGLVAGVGRTVKICNLLSVWEKVVDQRVGRHTEALKIKNGVLYVLASSPTWAQELTFLKTDIIKKFNSEAGQEAIKDIRFKSR